MDIAMSNTNDDLRFAMEIKGDTDGSSSDTSSSTAASPINFTAITMQDEYPSRKSNNTISSSSTYHHHSRKRKVHFIDEVVDTSPNDLVTSIRFRPTTRAEDKHILEDVKQL